MLQVQLAKLAGCHVIGTCSTDAKGEFLKVSLDVSPGASFLEGISYLG